MLSFVAVQPHRQEMCSELYWGTGLRIQRSVPGAIFAGAKRARCFPAMKGWANTDAWRSERRRKP